MLKPMDDENENQSFSDCYSDFEELSEEDEDTGITELENHEEDYGPGIMEAPKYVEGNEDGKLKLIIE